MRNLAILIDELRMQCDEVANDQGAPFEVRAAAKVAFNRMNVARYETGSSIELIAPVVDNADMLEVGEQATLF